MTLYFRVPKLDEYQHYKDRSPPWIKLHRRVLLSYEFSRLQDASKAHLMQIWLLASDLDNKIPHDAEWIGGKINATSPVDLAALQALNFIELLQNDSATLPERLQDAIPEREKRESREETKKEKEGDTSARPPARQNAQLDFELFKSVYPKRSGAQPWSRAVKAANARIKEGTPFEAMIAGAELYAKFCDAMGKTGSEFVMQASTFLGPERHFAEPWDASPNRFGARPVDNSAALAEAIEQVEQKERTIDG